MGIITFKLAGYRSGKEFTLTVPDNCPELKRLPPVIEDKMVKQNGNLKGVDSRLYLYPYPEKHVYPIAGCDGCKAVPKCFLRGSSRLIFDHSKTTPEATI